MDGSRLFALALLPRLFLFLLLWVGLPAFFQCLGERPVAVGKGYGPSFLRVASHSA